MLPRPLASTALRWSLPPELARLLSTPAAAEAQALPGTPSGRSALAEAVAARQGHLLLTGLTGPDRRVRAAAAISALVPTRRAARDLVAVPRLALPHRPALLELQVGEGLPFCRALRQLRDDLRVAWPDDLEAGPDAWIAAQGQAFQPLFERFSGAGAWLATLQAAVAARSDLFRPGVDPFRRGGDGDAEARSLLAAFEGQLLHAGGQGPAPVVVATDLSPTRLAGALGGGPGSAGQGLAGLRAGLLHDAHGGFLVVEAADLLRDREGWRVLRAALVSGGVALEGEGALQPDPAPLNLRLVVLAANGDLGALSEDPDLPLDHPVLLDPRPELGEVVLVELVGWVQVRAHELAGAVLAPAAVERLVLHLVRHSGRGGRISLDLARVEAVLDLALAHASGPTVLAADIDAALGHRDQRRALAADQARRSILQDLVRVRTEGAVTGQVNGLAVYRSAGVPYARPIRITASVGTGRGGLVDVERDVGLAGTSHSKAMRLVAGFLRDRFSRRRTLALHASIAVEQHYGRIDGDSASLAELCALLSSLARLPFRQDRALTGSVDQLGQVQNVGSANLKVEGFFQLCQARGLTGEQGVILPRRSQPDLMLDDEIVAACAAGRFHVWAVDTVEDALALLTDVPVGDSSAETWPEETVYGRISAELAELEAAVRRASKGDGAKR